MAKRGETYVTHVETEEGKVLVVEDAGTASLVVVRDLKERDDKIAVLKEVLLKIRT